MTFRFFLINTKKHSRKCPTLASRHQKHCQQWHPQHTRHILKNSPTSTVSRVSQAQGCGGFADSARRSAPCEGRRLRRLKRAAGAARTDAPRSARRFCVPAQPASQTDAHSPTPQPCGCGSCSVSAQFAVLRGVAAGGLDSSACRLLTTPPLLLVPRPALRAGVPPSVAAWTGHEKL